MRPQVCAELLSSAKGMRTAIQIAEGACVNMLSYPERICQWQEMQSIPSVENRNVAWDHLVVRKRIMHNSKQGKKHFMGEPRDISLDM